MDPRVKPVLCPLSVFRAVLAIGLWISLGKQLAAEGLEDRIPPLPQPQPLQQGRGFESTPRPMLIPPLPSPTPILSQPFSWADTEWIERWIPRYRWPQVLAGTQFEVAISVAVGERPNRPARPTFTPLPRLAPTPVPPPDIGIDLSLLPLLPDLELAQQVQHLFHDQVTRLNAEIAEKQADLHAWLSTWETDETKIRAAQAELSRLRTERERLSLEHLLVMRQLERQFIIPVRATPQTAGS